MSTPRTCPTCGAQVSDTERFCANCGSRLPDPPAAQPPATNPTVVLRPERPEVEPTQALPVIPPAGAPQSPPQGSPVYPPPASAYPGPQQSPPQGNPAFGVPPAAAPAAPARKGLPVWVMILIGVLGLCGIACVAGFFVLNLLGQRVSTVFTEINSGLAITAEALPTESAGVGGLVDTEEPAATEAAAPTVDLVAPTSSGGTTLGATPEAQPTTAGAGGIVGGVAGSGAGEAQTAAAATAEVLQVAAEATAEAQQLFANARQVFNEEFVDNRNNWFTGVFQEIEEDRIEDGVFKVIWSGKGFSYELYQVRELTNFIAEVDCLVYQGGEDGSCGVIFGQRDDVGFYEFEVFENYYRVTAFPSEGDAKLLFEGDPTGLYKVGEPNRLRVVRQGDQITAYLNDVKLDSASDSTFPTGKVGVSTNSYLDAGGVELWFDNFKVWQLP